MEYCLTNAVCGKGWIWRAQFVDLDPRLGSMADAQKWQSLRQAFCFHHAAAIIIITCREERERKKELVILHLIWINVILSPRIQSVLHFLLSSQTVLQSRGNVPVSHSYLFSSFPFLHFKNALPSFYTHVKLSEYPVWLRTWNGTMGILRPRNSRTASVFLGVAKRCSPF